MADARKIYVLNGPNLNMLGTREPEIYGYDTLDDIAERMEDAAQRAHVEIDFRQSNHEGHLIDWLQEAHEEGAHAAILNPHQREPFRHKSYVGMAAKGTIAGFGAMSYMLALEAALEL